MSLNLKTKIQGLEYPRICKEILVRPSDSVFSGSVVLGAVYMRGGTGRLPGRDDLTSRVESCLYDPALPGRDVRRDDFDALK
jgi:hypothetical protein